MPLAGICQGRQKGALCLKLHLSVCLSTRWLPAFRARFVDTGQKALGVYEFTFVLRTIYLLFQCCFSCAESLPKEPIISKPNRPLSRRIEHEIGNWAEGSACSDYPAALQPWPGAAPSFSLHSWLRPQLGCCFLAPFLAFLFWPARFPGAWQVLSSPFQLTATEGTLSPSLSWVEATGLLGAIIQQPSPLCRQWHVQKAGKA